MIDLKAATDTDLEISFKCLYSQCIQKKYPSKLSSTLK